MKSTLREVFYNNETIQYTLTRKKVKNINLRIVADGTIKVSASPQVPVKVIDGFVTSKGDFIQKAQQKQEKRQESTPKPLTYSTGEMLSILGSVWRLTVVKSREEGVFVRDDSLLLCVSDPENGRRREKVFETFWREECRKLFREKADFYHQKLAGYNIPYPTIKLRKMKSRWGSCTPSNPSITLNTRLLAYSVESIEYVVLHELCHLVHLNHGSEFWALVTSIMPDWKERKKLLG